MFVKHLVLLLICLQLVHSCDMDQIRQGCRIQNRVCSCGSGCMSEYRYASIQECQNALRGISQVLRSAPILMPRALQVKRTTFASLILASTAAAAYKSHSAQAIGADAKERAILVSDAIVLVRRLAVEEEASETASSPTNASLFNNHRLIFVVLNYMCLFFSFSN